MTRYTNVGRKRTFVQAGFGNDHDTEDFSGPSSTPQDPQETSQAAEPSSTEQPKKRRKRGKPKKLENTSAADPAGDGATDSAAVDGSAKKPQVATKASKGKKKLEKMKRFKDADARKFASERRRLKRQDLRYADTTCFACREKGHAAKDCPQALGSNGDANVEGASKKMSKSAVGICYRCGSKRHTLSRCPKSVDPQNPLPFASCFVCSGTGHLAGSCPQNQEKGIYPNGGCCKLCGKTAHLAKDCDLRKQEVASAKLFVGTGQAVGADEDDFHSFKRRTSEVNKEERGQDRLKRLQALKQGAHSGVVKSFGDASIAKPRKIVTF